MVVFLCSGLLVIFILAIILSVNPDIGKITLELVSLIKIDIQKHKE